jgi:hypothetical protein
MKRPGKEPDPARELPEGESDVLAAFRDRDRIGRALRRGVREALRIHKKLGHSIVATKNGKLVLIPPDQIPVDD